nr:uncharacterized protein LOC108127985 [Drosophila bipectinata]
MVEKLWATAWCGWWWWWCSADCWCGMWAGCAGCSGGRWWSRPVNFVVTTSLKCCRKVVVLRPVSSNCGESKSKMQPFPELYELKNEGQYCLISSGRDIEVTCFAEFTNIKCNPLDSEFDEFEYCLLKSVNRSYKYFSLKVKLLKIPITKVKVNFALLKKFNGYKPFLYNITVDACKTLRNPKSSPIFAYFHDAFKSFSNMNHTCPFDHDIIVDKLTINHVDYQFSTVLPFSKGEYLFHTEWYAYDVNRAIVDVYFNLY